MQSVAMNFTIDGDPVWFNGITGTVKGLQNWSSSNVNLPDGEDSVTKENSYTEQANIITPLNRHQKFWIVTPDGREKEISDPKLHCREGDCVSLIWGNDKDRKNWNYLVFKNHTTKETYFLENVFCTKKTVKNDNTSNFNCVSIYCHIHNDFRINSSQYLLTLIIL
ncbi:hypothetical protein AA0474_2712 [Acetobacter lovaniensis NRIC 0474]|nr:hypothetical protein AA0474_2712 [Acetobacter lovaniensis NRIC 0474]